MAIFMKKYIIIVARRPVCYGVQGHMLAPREHFENVMQFSAFGCVYFDQIVTWKIPKN